MKINKIYGVLSSAFLISIFSTMLCVFYEIPYLVLLRSGYIGLDKILLLQNIANFKFEFDTPSFLLFTVIVLVKIGILICVLFFYSEILKSLFISFYAKLYKILLGLVFFLPVVIIYLWVYVMRINIILFTGISIFVPSALIFILLFLFKEMEKTKDLVSDSDIKVFGPGK